MTLDRIASAVKLSRWLTSRTCVNINTLISETNVKYEVGLTALYQFEIQYCYSSRRAFGINLRHTKYVGESQFARHWYKRTWLTAISSHCLAALPAKMSAFNSYRTSVVPSCFAKTSNMKQKPKIGNLTEKQAQHGFGKKIQQKQRSADKLNIKAGIRHIRRNKPKMSKFSQKHAQIALSSKLKLQKWWKFEKKAICKTQICKKQANFK